MELCKFADKIGLKDVIKHCDLYLAQDLSVGDPIEYLNFAEANDLPETYRHSSAALISQGLRVDELAHAVSAQTFKKVIIRLISLKGAPSID